MKPANLSLCLAFVLSLAAIGVEAQTYHKAISVTFTIKTAKPLRGNLARHGGADIKEAEVQLLDSKSRVIRSVNAGPTGEYDLGVLPPGTYRVGLNLLNVLVCPGKKLYVVCSKEQCELGHIWLHNPLCPDVCPDRSCCCR